MDQLSLHLNNKFKSVIVFFPSFDNNWSLIFASKLIDLEISFTIISLKSKLSISFLALLSFGLSLISRCKSLDLGSDKSLSSRWPVMDDEDGEWRGQETERDDREGIKKAGSAFPRTLFENNQSQFFF